LTALVTGAGGAIGRAIAIRLAADGHPVAAVDIDMDAVDATADLIRERDGIALAIGCDLRHEDEIADASAKAERELGPVDVLVNNAAIFPSGPFVDVTVEELDDTFLVNQRAYFICAQLAARSMTSRRGGAIVNIASITWHGGWPNLSPYVATKGAIVALTRALATELGPHEIRVNAIAPGAFPTEAERAQHSDLGAYEQRIFESQALTRRGTLEELAAAVTFLAGPEASFITGQTLNVDGGWIMS
jgi:NAD(P)-dependent dehydrogenase (short-subunit alcohol dehydrogenase family)